MAIKIIRCQSPLHSTRAVNDGRSWSDSLGTYDGVLPPPVVCNRCAFADGIATTAPKTVDDIVVRFAQMLGVSEADAIAMLKAKSK